LADALSIASNGKDWIHLGNQIRQRTLQPATSFPFLVYLLIGVVLFGGLGIWAEILRLVIAKPPVELAGLIVAVLTFFPTLIGSTTLQLILASSSNSDKVMISFALLVLFIFLAAAVLLPFFSVSHPRTVLALAVVCSLAAIWVWWITNGLEPTFHSRQPDDATGGDPQRPMAGSFGDFKV
jgi:hypothetical protein